MSVGDSFLKEIENVGRCVKKRVTRVHQVLQEIETALLSELHQIEDTYRRDIKLDRDGNLVGIVSMAKSIRVISDYRVKENSSYLTDNYTKIRDQGASEAKTKPLLNADNDETLSKYNENHSQKQTTNSNIIKYPEKGIDAKNTPTNLTFKDNQSNSIESTSTTVSSSDTKSLNPITPITPNECPIEQTCTDTSDKGNHELKDDPKQYISPITEGIPTLGLKNLGNTCYMNSVIQCLSHTLPLRQLYVSDDYELYLNNKKDLSSAFKLAMLELWDTTSSDSVSPHYLKRQVGIAAPLFSDYNQHDAHEFMRFLLNELHEEINRASEEGRKSPADNETLEEACARYLTWEDSRISQLFSGMLRSDVCCSVCSNQSTAYIPFMDLSLPIPERNELNFSYYEPVRLVDCLKMITAEEILMEEERPYCNTCRDLTTSTKQLIICTLPRFLVIQLKRFSYYPTRTKLSTPVRFDDTWRLKDSSNSTHTYSLYGIACHSGSLYGGHYTAYCKYGGVWRCFNDSVTSIVSWEHVREQEAYILFYTEE